MEAPIEGIIVFALAVRAHPEVTHGGFRTIVGDVLDDGKPGPTVGAVGEGIAIAPILEGEKLVPAILAGGDIGGDKLILALLGKAVPNHKVGIIH